MEELHLGSVNTLEQNVNEQLDKEIRTIPPLMYIPEDQRKMLIKGSEIICKLKNSWIIDIKDNNDNNACYLLISGEAHVFDSHNNFLELIQKGTFFGYDGPLFGIRFYCIKAATKVSMLQIPQQIFEKLLIQDTVFSLNIARNLIINHNILGRLNNFKTLIRESRAIGLIDLERLVSRYKKFHSCLHPDCNSATLDCVAWLYSIRRLPANITSTFIFFISTKTPDMLSHPNIAMPIKTFARPRSIFQIMDGKCVVIMRDLETDLFDFLSNLCIHIVESQKLQQKLNSPLILADLLKYRNDQRLTEILLKRSGLTEEEVKGLSKIWSANLGEELSNILLHVNDFNIRITEPYSHLKQDPTEKWITLLWLSVLKLLNIETRKSCGAIPDSEIIVDIVQGSRRAFLNLVSAYVFKNRDEILSWGEKTKPQLVTKKFLCEEDKLYAYSYYYLLNHSEEASEKAKLELQHGVLKVEQINMTGVMITLVDCEKLKADLCDPAIKPKSLGKKHIIVNIGYTFGQQTADIMRAIMNVFGKKIRSVNIIGKAGGLIGSRGDILIADRIYSDESFEVVNNNLGDLNAQELEKEVGKPVHVGPMLTVAGTILQNSVLLNYYKKLYHCIGLEMEGLYFAREIKKYQELKLIRDDIICRFAYYVSDLPLNQFETLG